LSAILAGGLGAATLVQVLPEGTAVDAIAVTAQVLVFFVYLYLLSIFVYADASLGGKAAGFPPRLFTLPLRTRMLVAWPMLYGMAAAALLWLGLSWLILMPAGRGQERAWWVVALLLAASVTWFQALCWTLVRAPLLRLVVAIIGLPSIALYYAYAWARHNLQVTAAHLTLVLAASIVVSYAVAVVGVARDRRGDRLSWAWLWRLLARAAPRRVGRERSFASAAAAQRWLEIRRHGWILPAFTTFFLGMLFWAAALPLDKVDVARMAAGIVGFPMVLAFFVGFGIGKTSFWAKELTLPGFTATRPMTCATLAHAKLQAAGFSALATWGLVLLLAPLWALLSGNVATVRSLIEGIFQDRPAWQPYLLAPLILAGLVGLAWLQLVAGMCLSLTGRATVVNGVTLFYLLIGTTLLALVIWTGNHPEFFDTLVVVLWCLAAGLVLAKLLAAGWALRVCRRESFLDARAAAGLLGIWLAVLACVVIPLYALVPVTTMSMHLIAIGLMLCLPLARLLALPLAVAWNRHR
jgi:hypothetical protein